MEIEDEIEYLKVSINEGHFTEFMRERAASNVANDDEQAPFLKPFIIRIVEAEMPTDNKISDDQRVEPRRSEISRYCQIALVNHAVRSEPTLKI